MYKKIIAYAEDQIRKIGCFAAGTLVHTQEGLRPIEQVKVGDYVLSKPEIGFGEVSYKRVVNTFEYEDKEVWYIEAWMSELQCRDTDEDRPNHIAMLVVTGNHPFWVTNYEVFLPEEEADPDEPSAWVRADELQGGMRLRAHDGRFADVKKVKKLIRMGTQGYGWYESSSYDEYGWVVNIDGQRVNMCSGILPGEPALVPLDSNAKFPWLERDSLYLNEAVDWQNGNDDIYLATKVYNLEVEDNHTYFVDHMGVWVHNADCGEILQEQKLATKVFNEARINRESIGSD